MRIAAAVLVLALTALIAVQLTDIYVEYGYGYPSPGYESPPPVDQNDKPRCLGCPGCPGCPLRPSPASQKI